MRCTKGVVYIILFLIAFLLIAGCKTTPSIEAVVTKGDQSQIEKVIDKPQKQMNNRNTGSISIPSKWVNSIDVRNGLTINYNTDVIAPKLERYSIYEVTPAKFSQEMVDKFVGYFAGDKDLFFWEETLTKKDIEKELIEYLKGAEVDGVTILPDSDDPHIKELKDKIKTAPESAERRPATTSLQTSKDGSEELNLIIEWGNNDDAMITVNNFENGSYDSIFVFRHGGNLLNENDAVLNGKELKKATITEDEALELANMTLNELGISGMEFSSIIRADMEKMGSFAGMYSSYESSGYIVIYTRGCDGLKVVDTSTVGIYDMMDRSTSEYLPLYSAPWYQEMIMIYVDENGVSRFSWNGYEQISDKIVDDVQLMPFEDIMEHFNNQLFYQNGGELMYANTIDINVNRIEMGWALINKLDEPGKGLFVPAWFCFYEKGAQYDGADEFYKESGFLILNAVDGSVINPMPSS